MDEDFKYRGRRAKKHKSDNTVDIIEKILEFNEKYHNQERQGLKILTPEQMLSRLPITLAQLQAHKKLRME